MLHYLHNKRNAKDYHIDSTIEITYIVSHETLMAECMEKLLCNRQAFHSWHVSNPYLARNTWESQGPGAKQQMY